LEIITNDFEEAIVWATPFQPRHLFMTMLLNCEVTNGFALFDRYWPSMAEDISYILSLDFGKCISKAEPQTSTIYPGRSVWTTFVIICALNGPDVWIPVS
jgi:hypothetical protein